MCRVVYRNHFDVFTCIFHRPVLISASVPMLCGFDGTVLSRKKYMGESLFVREHMRSYEFVIIFITKPFTSVLI